MSKKTRAKKIDAQESIDMLMDNPLRMEIYFYLSTFEELSLSSLTRLVGKSKTTLHHHTRILEKKGVLVAREQMTRNYREKYYRIHPDLRDLVLSDDSLPANVDTERLRQQLALLYRSFSVFLFSVIGRFADYLVEKRNLTLEEIPENTLNMLVVDKKEYMKLMKLFSSRLSKVKSRPIDPTLTQDSYAVLSVFVPYSILFEGILDETEDI